MHGAMPIGRLVTSHARLLLADDHRMLREGLRRSLEERGLDVIGEAADGEEAVRLAEHLRPDVVLMDVSMPVLDGVDATRAVRARVPDTRVVMLTMHGDPATIRRALRAGASGYLVKDCSISDIVSTIERVASGEVTLSPELAESILNEAEHMEAQSLGGASLLSSREKEVLQLIADGLSTQELASKLYISLKTVRNHLASIYQKLESRDRTEAVLRAVRMGIVSLD
jgi:DNA-binding NarL/FixJ family response regulator